MPGSQFALDEASRFMRAASRGRGEPQPGGPFAGQGRRLARRGDCGPSHGPGRCDRGRRGLCRAASGIAQAQRPDAGRSRVGVPCPFTRFRSRPSRGLDRTGVASSGSRLPAGGPLRVPAPRRQPHEPPACGGDFGPNRAAGRRPDGRAQDQLPAGIRSWRTEPTGRRLRHRHRTRRDAADFQRRRGMRWTCRSAPSPRGRSPASAPLHSPTAPSGAWTG